ncbi:hypothetical protein [Mesorhizobium sp. WSM4884]|uniref:hypothetical protein n=1 Tax=Mesorhizobium sp. WSM4884 TaxID=3038542 RepID=UPI002415D55C|nr:hypothetical protein [Mesorhizobium sp. WSM4884]MDG4884332.1 hypothetical protein [Mesorhizobium sp. WSM4884]
MKWTSRRLYPVWGPQAASALKKDVTVKCHGGVTRERKLLDKLKEGKKRMRQFGKVDIPQ